MDIGHSLLNTGFFDMALLAIGFGVGFVRSKQVVTFMRVSLIVIKMAKWYFSTHPHAKTVAHENPFKNEMEEFDQRLSEVAPSAPASLSCLGAGEIPSTDTAQAIG